MLFQNLCVPFPYVLLRCSSRPDLHSQFVNIIEQGAHERKNVRISPSWAVSCYRIEHIVNFSLQILLCRVPSGEENLVENRNQVCQWVPGGTSLTLLDLSGQWQSDYFMIDTACCDAPASTLKASKLDGLNCQCRRSSSGILKEAFLLTFSKYAAAAFLTRLTRRGKRRVAREGMNGFKSVLVSMLDSMALRRVW